MGLPLLLFLPFYAVLLLPVCSFLLFLVKLLCQAILRIFWKQARTHFTLWPPDSSFLGHHRLTGAGDATAPSKPLPHERLGVCQYEAKAGDGEQTECVFCLCAVEEGDEIRELRCQHLFHRACLDKWLEHGRATCPLCRGPLLPPGPSKVDQYYADAADEEGLPEDLMGLPLTVFIRSSFLLW
ncbi:hypothetical protein Taro_025391 [Colocasia esculenta]|uniref:RING-type domain-containing protein n=1 Tax=Colocasia esculenta TaxID=4460 RepID=A0A843VGF1_COLES|nr:hypothetical protein [Colocasia esculenta]